MSLRSARNHNAFTNSGMQFIIISVYCKVFIYSDGTFRMVWVYDDYGITVRRSTDRVLD